MSNKRIKKKKKGTKRITLQEGIAPSSKRKEKRYIYIYIKD